MKPFILINFKTYREATGRKALRLARELANVKRNKYEIAIAPSMLTLKEIADKTNLTVFSQHTDHASLGSFTGRISAEELIDIGVKGTILNHSERKIPLNFLGEIIGTCKKNGLKTVACASTLSEIKKITEFSPDYIAYEPKELIGREISVTEAKPEIIVEAVELIKGLNSKTKLLCGAGINSKEDLGQALLLGAKGVLISHAVIKAKNPEAFLAGMLI